MKEYRSIPIGLGLIILVLAGTYYLYIQERQHQKDMMEIARNQFYVESDVLSSQGEAHLNVTLYFPQLDWTGSDPFLLVEESRPILQTRDRALVVHQIINELMKGPIDGKASIFSEQAVLRQIYLLEDGTAIVDFSQEATQLLVGGVLVEFAALYSIVRSLIENVEGIKRVKFLVEGRENATFAGHISIQKPFM